MGARKQQFTQIRMSNNRVHHKKFPFVFWGIQCSNQVQLIYFVEKIVYDKFVAILKSWLGLLHICSMIVILKEYWPMKRCGQRQTLKNFDRFKKNYRHVPFESSPKIHLIFTYIHTYKYLACFIMNVKCNLLSNTHAHTHTLDLYVYFCLCLNIFK